MAEQSSVGHSLVGRPDLADLAGAVRSALGGVNAAREAGLADCRRAIRSAGSAIRAIHRRRPDDAESRLGECERPLRAAHEGQAPFPAVAHAGFLHDAEKEFAEAGLTGA